MSGAVNDVQQFCAILLSNHPEITITIDGKSGDDAKPYQEKDVREAIAVVRRHEADR